MNFLLRPLKSIYIELEFRRYYEPKGAQATNHTSYTIPIKYIL